MVVSFVYLGWQALDFQNREHKALSNTDDTREYELDNLTYVGEADFLYAKREKNLPEFLKWLVTLSLNEAIAIATAAFGALGGLGQSIYRIMHVPQTPIRRHWLLPLLGAFCGLVGTFLVLQTERFLFSGGFPRPLTVILVSLLFGCYYENVFNFLKTFVSKFIGNQTQ